MSSSLSISIAEKLYVKTPSSSITASGIKSNSGGSFTGLTVKLKVCETSKSPSDKTTVTAISP